MKPKLTTHATSIRHRQIGRKVLQADRLARALSASKHKKTRNVWCVPSLRPKVIAIICIVIVGISALGFGGSQYYFAQVDKTQKAAAIEQQSKL